MRERTACRLGDVTVLRSLQKSRGRCNRVGVEQPEIKNYFLRRQHEQHCGRLVREFKVDENECGKLGF